MKFKSIYIITLIVFTNISMNLFSQNSVKKIFTADSIPPLQVFMDSAMINSPAIKMYETQIAQNQYEMELLKYNWMKDIYMVVDSKYGKYGNAQPGDQMSLGYGGGAVVKIPITAFAGSGQRKKIAKLELDQSVYNKEVLISELKKSLIRHYNETIYIKQILSIRIEALEVAAISQKLSENEFKGGLIHVDQYSRVSEIYYSQLQQLEKTKMELKTALAILLEMSGIKH
jgi:outer membrane protein TolC